MTRSAAYLAGFDAGWDTRNYTYAYGGECTFSWYRYKSEDGTRSEYEEGWEDGVSVYDYERDTAELCEQRDWVEDPDGRTES